MYAKKHNKDLFIEDVSGFGKNSKYGNKLVLDQYELEVKFISNYFLKHIIGNNYFWIIAYKLGFVYREKSITTFDGTALDSNYSFYQGYWQSENYFTEMRDILRNNIKLKDISDKYILKIQGKIELSINSVAIGMRFHNEEDLMGEHDVFLKDNYYESAINILMQVSSKIDIFVFTLDVSKAKRILAKYKNVTYITPTKDFIGARHDLHLMSLCDNFIISVSTFYWWAAYLGEKDNSTVIVPNKGFANKDISPKEWIKINV